ncbi:conserved hypothetical protein [Desulfatibacillum aliphaticivorans]|uniref:Uncharacterized protein n=1 Tax=Desulfatibacillum aliphaticivorans TaxID=218208 RepID=B8FNS2_DESAL|nr:hypothetical protein [Desulfatibacillum aliphaticivorans]ACL06353.1 conserved hypothetical protein [Desulfatibacillum aliphaticivorans]
MPDNVNSQVTDALTQLQSATMDPGVVVMEGKGKAFQSISQSMAIAIQDAVDYMRNVSTMSATAQGVAMAKFLETKNQEYLDKALKDAIDMATNAADSFGKISASAKEVLGDFDPAS